MIRPPKTVAWVIPYPNYGGPHNELLRTREVLASLGYRSVAIVPDEPGDGATALAGHVRVAPARMRRFSSRMHTADWVRKSVGLRKEVASLRSAIESCDADLVRVHGLHNPEGALAARALRLPVVWSIMSDATPRHLRAPGSWLYRRLASSGLVTGRAVLQGYPGVLRAHVPLTSYLPPVDPAPFMGMERHNERATVVLLSVGTLGPQKDQKLAVEVLHRLLATGVDATLVLVGGTTASDPTYSARVLEHARDLGVSERVASPGHATDVRPYLEQADIYLSTSVAEGVPAAIMEAMAAGLPVVAPNVGSISDIVTDQVTGFVVAERSVEQLAGAALELAASPALRRAQGHAARAVASDRFGIERTALAFATAFDHALGRATETPSDPVA